MNDDTNSAEPRPGPRRTWYRLALVATVVLVVGVVVLLPVAIGSMQQVLGRGPDPAYDVVTGQVVVPPDVAGRAPDATYANLGAVALDQATGQLTVAVSGNRICQAACPALSLILVSLDANAEQRSGLPPSATLELAPSARVFSQTVQLPVWGQPTLYPFDQYRIRLGISAVASGRNGATVPISPTSLAERNAVITIQNRLPDLIMAPPVPVDPQSVRAATDPFPFLAVQELTFVHPAYLKVLAVVLVSLIAVSATMALFRRDIDELALGIGGLILGVWGVRSVLMPQATATVTAIDLALSWVIMFLLLGLVLRAALHFLRRSELPVPGPRRKS